MIVHGDGGGMTIAGGVAIETAESPRSSGRENVTGSQGCSVVDVDLIE